MNKAFVDTTIFADCLLKVGEKQSAAKKLLKKFDKQGLPVFAIREFKAGVLSNFIWAHNELAMCKSYTKAFQNIQNKAIYKRYKLLSSLEALTTVMYMNKLVPIKSIKEKSGEYFNQDEYLVEKYRTSLKFFILKAWQKRRKLTTDVINELNCYSELDIRETGKFLDSKPIDCSTDSDCCLLPLYKKNITILKQLREELKKLKQKPERDRQIKLLKDIIKRKNELTSKECRSLGDIYFLVACPVESTIITTNESDFKPLCEAIGKKMMSPKDLEL